MITGSFCGSLSSLKAHQLGSVVISEVLKRANVNKNDVSEVILGQVSEKKYVLLIFLNQYNLFTIKLMCNMIIY